MNIPQVVFGCEDLADVFHAAQEVGFINDGIRRLVTAVEAM